MKTINQQFLINEMQRLENEIQAKALDHSINMDLVLNQLYGYSLKVYILLTYLFPYIKIEEHLSKEDIFYNRYLWFTRFAKQKEKQEGYDAGINQQSVRLLEEVDYDSLEIDWNTIQRISNELDIEIAQSL
jgi:hypothetical protein